MLRFIIAVFKAIFYILFGFWWDLLFRSNKY